MLGPAAKREAVAHLKAVLGLSERQACSIVSADRTMIRYRSQRPTDTALRERLRALANERRRFGYRRLFVLLRRDGEPSGINRIYRLYREEGLTVRKRRARRRAVGTRAPILVEAKANARWSVDFVHDQLACGRRFRVFNVVDDVTRKCLVAIADTSISGRRVVRELTTLIARRGKPGMIVSDHGTEFTSNVMLAWADDYNRSRPHSALGYQTPAVYAANLTAVADQLLNAEQLRRSTIAPAAPHGAQSAEVLVAAGCRFSGRSDAPALKRCPQAIITFRPYGLVRGSPALAWRFRHHARRVLV